MWQGGGGCGARSCLAAAAQKRWAALGQAPPRQHASTAHISPSLTSSLTFQFKPAMPNPLLPTAPMMPAVCVPWPAGHAGGQAE